MFIAVAIGAFGAHMLKERLTTYGLDIFKTASLYHFIHAFGLFIVAWIRSKDETSKINKAGFCFVIGIILFSGSLYALAITQIKILGAITPLGGLAFLIGWALIFFNTKTNA